MIANAVNLASFANALCHLNTTPLSVAVLAPCVCGRSGQSENVAVFGRGTSLSLSLSLSLVARTFWHAFGLNLKGFFTYFIVVSSRLIVNFSCFIVVFSRLFTYKRHFLGHCAFLKFLNALFLGFLRLSLRAFSQGRRILSF